MTKPIVFEQEEIVVRGKTNTTDDQLIRRRRTKQFNNGRIVIGDHIVGEVEAVVGAIRFSDSAVGTCFSATRIRGNGLGSV